MCQLVISWFNYFFRLQILVHTGKTVRVGHHSLFARAYARRIPERFEGHPPFPRLSPQNTWKRK